MLTEVLNQVHINTDDYSAVVGGHEIPPGDQATLHQKLAEALYLSFHVGRWSPVPRQSMHKPDPRLRDDLRRAVPHASNRITVTLRSVAEQLVVEWDGVLVRVPRAMASVSVLPRCGESVQLDVPSARPALSPGFLFVEGSRAGDFEGDLVRVYLHVAEAEHAAGIWGAVLRCLEGGGVAYQAKVLSRTWEYPRRDAIVVYLPTEHADADQLIAHAVADETGLAEDVSVFAERRAPGIARAWEPSDKRVGMSGLSFGQHRAKVLATALLDSAATGEPREDAVVRAFVQAGVDPANPARNLV